MSSRIPADRIQTKRVYIQDHEGDGSRILVDRLWPRGLSKQHADVDLWLKTIAPTDELRKWFGHEPARWAEFRRRYRAELRANPEPVHLLRDMAQNQKVTLVYGARDESHNQAVAIREFLLGPEAEAP